MTVTFQDLLAKTSANGGQSADELQAERTKLQAEVGELEQQVAARRTRLREVEGLLQAPVKAAVKAAELLGLEVPEEYRTPAHSPAGSGFGEGYLWQASPLPGDNRSSDLAAREMTVSRAMWAYSKGSGGSAGKSGEGILSSQEFSALLGNQTGSPDIKPGATVKVTLPNGRELKVTRLKQ